MSDPKIIELAKKMKALADKGVGGEKETAERKLKELMEKYNLSLEDIESEVVDHHFINLPDDPNQYRLLRQIIARVNIERRFYGKFDKKTMKQVGGYSHSIKCTNSEFIEIMAMFDWYKVVLKKELDAFFYAFFSVNDLLVSRNSDDGEISEEDRLKAEKAAMMAMGLSKDDSYRKRLENKTNE